MHLRLKTFCFTVTQRSQIMLEIVTITYQRPKLLERLFESILKANEHYKFDFRWIVVFNSFDAKHKELKERIIHQLGERFLPIVNSENIGLTPALNLAYTETFDQSFVLRVDDDDYITSDAFRQVDDDLKQYLIPNNDLSGILYDTLSNKGRIIGSTLGYSKASTNFELHNLLGLTGDKTRLIRAHILKEYPYPTFDGENFVPDAYLYYSIDFKYRSLYLPKSVKVREYLGGGLSDGFAENVKRNSQGFTAYYKLLLTHPEQTVKTRCITLLKLARTMSIIPHEIKRFSFLESLLLLALFPFARFYNYRQKIRFRRNLTSS